MVEELAEEGHPGIERSRQAFVRRNVRDRDRVAIARDAEAGDHTVKRGLCRCFLLRRRCDVAKHDMHRSKRVLDGLKRTASTVHLSSELAVELGEGQRRDDGRRVVERHVRNKVRDQAGVGVGNAAIVAVVIVGDRGGARSGRAKRHCIAVRFIAVVARQEARHGLVGGTPGFAAVSGVVEGAINRAQTVGRHRRGDGERSARRTRRNDVPISVHPNVRQSNRSSARMRGRIGFSDLDLFQNENEIGNIQLQSRHVLNPTKPGTNANAATMRVLFHQLRVRHRFHPRPSLR